jgi:hypothetical protein
MRIGQVCFITVIAVALATDPISAQSASNGAPWQHRGFRCDMSGIDGTELAAEVHAAVREQIDIVCAIGLQPGALDYFRTIPLKVVGFREGSPGRYNDSNTVELSVAIVAYHHRPVLLHEFLHAFHEHELKNGIRNQEIRTYYQRAKQKDVYSSKSHMMDNVQEFFACSATTYLVGYTGQEPFLREKLRSNQPQFFEHLQALFGPDTGTYEGSREGPDLKRLDKLRRPTKAPEPTTRPVTIRAHPRIAPARVVARL